MLWALALVIALPVLAWGLSQMIVHGGSAGFRWMHRKQYERWHGMYYEFANVQLRHSFPVGRKNVPIGRLIPHQLRSSAFDGNAFESLIFPHLHKVDPLAIG